MTASTSYDTIIVCVGGYPLSARVFEPTGRSRQTVVIAPATGAKASYYWRYGAYLASRGLRAIVADYRGTGRSTSTGSPTALRRLRVRWHEWGTLDLDAVMAWSHATAPDHELLVVGHSFGGLAATLAANAPRMSRLLMVGSQHAHWPDYARRHRMGMVWRWHVAMPILTTIFRYFPGRRTGWLEDLPAGVALDWAGGRRDFAHTIGPDGPALLAQAARLTLDVLAVAPTDDPFATPQAMQRTLRYLPRARIERCSIDPASVGVSEIGHLGLFHERFRDNLWSASVDWLTAPSDADTRP